MRQLRIVRRAGARATALFVAAVLCLSVTGWGHADWDDAACDPSPVYHDHTAHRFQDGTLPANPPADHCLFCHSLRSLGNGLVSTATPVADGAQAVALRASDVVLAGRLLDPHAPSRAPPVAFL